jgi:regulatory protein
VRRKPHAANPEKPAGPPGKPRSPFELACRYMAVSERCAAQVRGYLKRKGIEEEEISRTIDLLRERRLLDDLRYARLYVESRSRRSPRSPALLVKELLVKGVDSETARRAVSGFLSEVPEEELIRRLLARIPSGGPDARERAARRLRSRGFRSGAALGHEFEEDNPENVENDEQQG